jgi:hypothetical protein
MESVGFKGKLEGRSDRWGGERLSLSAGQAVDDIR